MKLHVTVPALLIVLCMPGAYAASVTLSVKGTFADGAALSGTMTVDQTAGTITAANLTVGSPDSGNYTVIDPQVQNGVNYLLLLSATGSAVNSTPALWIVLPQGSLVGYNGGAVCAVGGNCAFLTNIFKTTLYAGESVQLTSGTVTGSAPAPTTVPALSPWALGILAILFAASAALLLRRPKYA